MSEPIILASLIEGYVKVEKPKEDEPKNARAAKMLIMATFTRFSMDDTFQADMQSWLNKLRPEDLEDSGHFVQQH